MNKLSITTPSYGNRYYHFGAEYDFDTKKGELKLSKTGEKHFIELDETSFNDLLDCLDIDKDRVEGFSGIDVNTWCKTMGVFEAIDTVWRHFKPELFDDEF